MKIKLGDDLVTSEKFEGDLSSNAEQQRSAKTSSRKESVTPRIVVCPPMEDTVSETLTARRGARLLRVFRRRQPRQLTEDDSVSSSSSNDSVSCETGRVDDPSSCSTSDSGSDGSDRHRRHHSTVSLRRVFQNLNLTLRSQSSSPTERQRPPKKQAQPKRILRSPVTYTYVRGLSGLPTQRVPRHAVYCATSGLNR